MKTLKFKTNITCKGCLANVTPVLNSIEDIENWEVDIAGEDKILSVTVSNDDIAGQINEKLKEIGYFAEKI